MSESAQAEAPATTPAKTVDPAVKERQDKVREAYGAATKRLREAHLDEFRALQKEEAAKRGVDWTPKPTSEERAEADLVRIISEHPALKERVRSEVLGGSAPAEADATEAQ